MPGLRSQRRILSASVSRYGSTRTMVRRVLDRPVPSVESWARVGEGRMIGPADPVMKFFQTLFTMHWELDGRALMFAAILVALLGAFVGMYFWDHSFDE